MNQVMLQMKMAPKIYYVPEIYLRFGRDYGRSFLEQEAAVDVNSVISQHNFDELVSDDADTEDIVDEIVSRIEDAAFFHKIKLRDPVGGWGGGREGLCRISCSVLSVW